MPDRSGARPRPDGRRAPAAPVPRPAPLHLRLFGGFELRSAGRAPSPVPSSKARALLAYLALHPDRELQRGSLAALLWSEASATAARTSLRQCLHVLRRSIGDDGERRLVGRGTSLRLVAGGFETDAVRFVRYCDHGAPRALEAAIDLYRGELLEGIDLYEEPFEEWLLDERRRLRERLSHALSGLLRDHERAGRTEQAIRVGMRSLTLDPLHETVHRTLMRCFERQGRKRSALRQFGRCRDALRRELGAEPGPETQRLYRRLLAGTDAGAHRIRVGTGGAGGLSIVVRPLEALGGSARADRLGDALAEDLATELARIPGLTVYGGVSGGDRDPLAPEIDRATGAAGWTGAAGTCFVLEGSVRRAGGRLRVNVHLLDAANGAHLWAERYDRDAGEPLALQDEMTRTIVESVALALTHASVRFHVPLTPA